MKEKDRVESVVSRRGSQRIDRRTVRRTQGLERRPSPLGGVEGLASRFAVCLDGGP